MTAMVLSGGEMAVQQSGFDYSQLDRQTATEVQQIVDAVRQSNVSMAQHYIDNGKRLLIAFEKVPPGQWTDWLLKEFNWTQGTANKMMRIARFYGHLHLESSQVSTNALMDLSRSDIPTSIREEAVSRIEAGLIVSSADAESFRVMHGLQPVPRGNRSDAESTRDLERVREHELMLSTAEMGFAVRNMQVALANSYPVPFKAAVADALEHLQATADELIQRVRKDGRSKQKQHHPKRGEA